MGVEDLYWLPEAPPDFNERLKAVAGLETEAQWPALVSLANHRMDFLRTARLDVQLRKIFPAPPNRSVAKPVRLAILASSTVTQLVPPIRVAALRRAIHVTAYEAHYGQYVQELRDKSSGLFAFKPNVVLFSLDAPHLLGGISAAMKSDEAEGELSARIAQLASYWKLAREAFGAQVLQQTVLNRFAPLLGSNEHRLPSSPRQFIRAINERLRDAADAAGVDLVDVDARAAEDGLRAWHDTVLWLRAKQDVTPVAGPMYGELVARVIAAAQGKSAKCLVLDLDNTLWGGVIGEDGLDGIRVGQGSAEGEAYLKLQSYALDLASRGVILAVCSKNDEAVALAGLRDHPEMLMRPDHVASFVANWNDKPANLRRIAHELNIGLDSLVFADDNPFERNLVRRELPEVLVPELPEDVANYAQCIADAGYFETLAVTEDDRQRSALYRGNRDRESFKAHATDIESYLSGLEMSLISRPFDRVGLKRIVQLINKTNQFNLTTRRYTEAEVLGVIEDRRAFGLQLRLVDRFGDNGIIAIVIGRQRGDEMEIDTWLMSCRVLGRQVEEATLNLIAQEAARRGAKKLVGIYRPSARNDMVREHYTRLNFLLAGREEDGASRHVLDLSGFTPRTTSIRLEESIAETQMCAMTHKN